MSKPKVIFIPGNGGGKPAKEWYWFPYAKKELEKKGFPVILEEFPDPVLARASFWIPFLHDTLKADKNTILVGHSSGAIAAMRYAEKYEILGSVLVAGYHTDLGIETEKLSGYFDEPWDFDAIRNHQKWIIQFASTDDPWIPIDEPRFVHAMTSSEYKEYNTMGHYGGDSDKREFHELVDAIVKKLHS